jgi:GTP diphosphokinase / guanosine-3',5'-bis(diphosphate) 3'-diphosphatase
VISSPVISSPVNPEAILALNGFPELSAQLEYLDDTDRARVEAAYRFAAKAHDGVLRKSGEPYITHPVSVAGILAGLRMDVEAIQAGLLHDTVEDTTVTFEDINREFGLNVRRLVEGETKVSKLSRLAKEHLEDEQAENLRQLLVAMTDDIRIIVVKLADRLHNMRTLGAMKPEKQIRIATETRDIYAPLAHRLGIGSLKWELEDLAFKYLEPIAYRELANQIRLKQDERDAYVERAIEFLRGMLETDRELNRWLMRFEISGRSKHLYSIYGKMQRETKNLEQIFDLLAIRVILEPRNVSDAEIGFVASESDPPEVQAQKHDKAKADAESLREKRVCYHTLGIVHSLWTPIPGRFKDYIAVPKPNGYQSLHSTVISLEGQPIEVQLRTSRMHSVAEFGVAAHWAYKQGIDDPLEVEKRAASLEDLRKKLADPNATGRAPDFGSPGLKWLEDLRNLQLEIKDAGDFVDAVQSDFLGQRVFVFTPKGETINLPLGATPIDMAYHVHTNVGHHAVGARVNGHIVPLSHQLDNGDRVEIMTNRGSNGPSKDWMNFAVTRSARTKIRSFFRAQERAEALVSGHDGLARYLRKKGLPAAKLMRTKTLEDTTEKLLGSRNPDELYLALTSKRLNYGQVTRVLAPDLEPEPMQAPAIPKATPKGSNQGVFIEGIVAPVKFAQCCKPIRGDSIIGYITRGRSVSVHRENCPNAIRLNAEEPDRVKMASWEEGETSSYPTDIEVHAIDRAGLLKEILDVVSNLKKNVLKFGASVHGTNDARIELRLELRHQDELEWVREAILKIRDVRSVIRRGAGPKPVQKTKA